MTEYTIEYERLEYPPTVLVGGNGVTLSWKYNYNTSTKYPYQVNILEQKDLKMLNTKLQFEIVEGENKEIEAYSVHIETDEINTNKSKYVGVTREFLHTCPLIECSDGKMIVGYIECEVIGYVPDAHGIYILKVENERV